MSTAESAARNQVARAENPFGNAPVVAAPSASAAALMQREAQDIQVAMLVARNFPRDVIRAGDKIINAFSRPTLCEEAMYAYSKGGQNVSGLSIRAAEVLAQNWGNIRTGVQELNRSNGQSEFRAYAQDLETGFMDEKFFFVRHWIDTKRGGRAAADEREIYEIGANMGSRRKRACILAVIPKDVQDLAEHQIELTLRNKAEITPESIKNLLDAFAHFGVSKEMIEKRIQRRIDAMLPAQLVQMRRIYNSLKDGMSEPNEWFEMVEQTPSADDKQPTSQTEAAKAALKAKQGQKADHEGDDKIPHGREPKYDKDKAISAIKAVATLKDLSAVYEEVIEDYDSTKRKLPDEVERAFVDRKLTLEQAAEK